MNDRKTTEIRRAPTKQADAFLSHRWSTASQAATITK